LTVFVIVSNGMPSHLLFRMLHPSTQWKSEVLVMLGWVFRSLRVNVVGFSTSPVTSRCHVFGSIFGIGPMWRSGVPFASVCPGGNLWSFTFFAFKF
jgi:hypothetical protein